MILVGVLRGKTASDLYYGFAWNGTGNGSGLVRNVYTFRSEKESVRSIPNADCWRTAPRY